MAVTSRHLHNRRIIWSLPHRVPRQQLALAAYALTALLALVALYVLLAHTLTWGTAQLDTLRYGLPRTYHLSADVGHSGTTHQPSHLIALNLDRQVIVLDIPGGDTEQTRVLRGPYLFGEDEHLTPVTLRLNDLNADAAPELILQVKNEDIIYMNRDGAFELITPVEQQHLLTQEGVR